MKLERMIGILSILLQKEKVTAPYLAEKFEVSRRTINRDIEAICMAELFQNVKYLLQTSHPRSFFLPDTR